MSTRSEKHKVSSTHFGSLPSELSVRWGKLLFLEDIQLLLGSLPDDDSYLAAIPSLALIAVDSSKWSRLSIMLGFPADDGYGSESLNQVYGWPIICLSAYKEAMKSK
jgi:hypothetical protein